MGVLTRPVLPKGTEEALPAGTPEEEALRRRMLETLLAPVEADRMSYEEFLAWADEDTWAEWVDGEVIMMSPASDRHQDLSGFLGSVFRSFLTHRPVSGILEVAPETDWRVALAGRLATVWRISSRYVWTVK